MTFAADVAVRRVKPGLYEGELRDRWLTTTSIHGGYAAAVVANAMRAAVDDPSRHLRTFSSQLAAPPEPGPVEIQVRIERKGRSMTVTSARLVQSGRVLQVAHAVSSISWSGTSYDDHVCPRSDGPGDAPLFEPPLAIRHFDNVEVRLDPDVVLFGEADRAWVAAWLRPLDRGKRDELDAAWIVAMCDVLPPALVARTAGPVRAATVVYTVHMAQTRVAPLADGDYVYLSCRSPLASEGFAVEDATMWGGDGRVVALARQTRLAGG